VLLLIGDGLEYFLPFSWRLFLSFPTFAVFFFFQTRQWNLFSSLKGFVRLNFMSFLPCSSLYPPPS